MKIYSFSQQGKRSNNEDYKGYNERLWVVCDGVGGHVSGERASQFVVETMLGYFQQDTPSLTRNDIQDRLVQVQKELNDILDDEPELEKMGTTFTGVFKTDTYWYAAHLGDSRIYLFRPSEQKLWHTWDHSLVGELMKHKDITIEEGRHHPLSNRIQKAMIANFEKKTNTSDIVKFDELRQGDIFLLCSDGVIEAWSDMEFVNLFSDEQLSFEEKGKKLQQQCETLSNDNNTAMLLEIEANDAFSYGDGNNEELKWTTFQDIQDDYQEYLNKQKEDEEDMEDSPSDIENSEMEIENAEDNQEDLPMLKINSESQPATPKKKKKKKRWIVIAIILLLLGVAAGVGVKMYLTNHNPKQEQTTPRKSKKQQTPANNKKQKNNNSNRTNNNSNLNQQPAPPKTTNTPPSATDSDNKPSSEKKGNGEKK